MNFALIKRNDGKQIIIKKKEEKRKKTNAKNRSSTSSHRLYCVNKRRELHMAETAID